MIYRVLVMEDDPGTRSLLEESLKLAKYSVISTDNHKEGLAYAAEKHPDLILLDYHIQGLMANEMIQKLSKDPATQDIPVIVITASHQPEKETEVLKMGAADYWQKTDGPAPLIARIERTLRSFVPAHKKHYLQAGFLRVDMDTHLVEVDGAPIKEHLTPKEFDLLCVIMKGEGRILQRWYLYELVWGEPNDDGSRALDKTIQRLREKLGTRAAPLIVNVPTEGYRLGVEILRKSGSATPRTRSR